ncbi:hypothetical protein SUGI_0001740 [Cryptomeria japonica]|uniref:uncharacterized protein LOC131071267 n=1 Tax=Cryptomeria japonica TaxID=3369 RepID=UPI002408A6B9|nr:uncharacterized protein LOC131071267 [Cryptomeria japonica]GLJ04711.1 hypothetical protein SUGI_0001740 [Cryptomeria japonica]
MAKCGAVSVFTVLLLLSVCASLSQARSPTVPGYKYTYIGTPTVPVVKGEDVYCPACVCCEPAVKPRVCCRCCAAPITSQTQSQTSNP